MQLKHFWVICDSHFIKKWTRFLSERTVSSSITIRCLATIWTAAIYVFSFHFEMPVASRVLVCIFLFGRDQQFAGPFGL